MSCLADALGTASGSAAIGIEHEYVVDGGRCDFRSLLPLLDLPGAELDPGDPDARRGGWGGAITADGREAEVASPPTELSPGFTGRLVWWAEQGRARLQHAVGDRHLEGYSTHLSCSVPTADVAPVAREIAHRYATSLMLLLDAPHSPGVLVRPRPGRVEICGEHVDGEHLRGSAALVAGATLATTAELAAGRQPAVPAVRVAVEPARIRQGWYVDRAAAGGDLYRQGRAMPLRTEDGSCTTAGDHLRRCWDVARAALERVAADVDLEAGDALVDGRLPLRVEDVGPLPTPPERVVEASTPFSRLGLGRRPGFTVRPVVVQWHGVAFAVDDHRTAARHLWIPTAWLEDFLVELHDGRLDSAIERSLAGRVPRRSLADSVGGSDGGGDAVPGTFGGLGDPTKLVPGEPHPVTGVPGSGGPAGRADKQGDAPEPRRPKLPRRPVLVGAAIAVVVVISAVAVAAIAGGGEEPDETERAVATTVVGATTSTTPSTTASTSLPTTTLPLVPPGPLVVTASFVGQEPAGGPAAPPGPVELGTLTCSGTTCTYVVELSTAGEASVDLATGTGSGRWSIPAGGDCTGNPAFVGAIDLTARVVDEHVEGELVFRADSVGETASGQPGGTCLGLVTTFTYVADAG